MREFSYLEERFLGRTKKSLSIEKRGRKVAKGKFIIIELV